MDERIRRFAELARDLRAQAGAVRIVGIDGCGGAGKTTFAARLAHVLRDAPVVHTDDFASHDVPIEWWPRTHADVVEPLLRGVPATYFAYDWVARRFSDTATTVEPRDVVLVEGVGATHAAWRERLAMRIWVDCPRELRLARGLARDGEDLRDFWLDWMRAEDAYVDAERPFDHVDLVVDGASTAPDPDNEFVVRSPFSARR